MVRIGSYMWLVSASIGILSLTRIDAETKNRIREVTVRSLKFLSTYQANVAAHRAGGPVEEEQIEGFLEEWKGSFFTPEETLTRLYNSVEKDWRYALDLASSKEDNLSELVVALYAKMEAYLQSFYYMPCFTISVNPERYNSDHCQNLAVYLLIFSYIGTDQLMEKLSWIAGSSLSADNSFGIKVFKTLLLQFYHDLKYNLREKQHRAPDENKMSDGALDEYLHLLANNELLVTIKGLSSSMIFGPLRVTVQRDMPHWYDADYLKFMWEKAEGINKRLTDVSQGYGNYDITSALQDIIIQRTEFWQLSQLDFANELNEVKQKNLEIRLHEGGFSINLN